MSEGEQHQGVIRFFSSNDPDSVGHNLSNFAPIEVAIPTRLGYFPWADPNEESHIVFPHAESAFHAYKSPGDEDYVRSLARTDVKPRSAKNLGRRVELRSDWEEVKVRWMFVVVWHKFAPRIELLERTGTAKLIEQNVHDNFWGIGRGQGKNYLGRCIMLARELLNKKTTIENFDTFVLNF